MMKVLKALMIFVLLVLTRVTGTIAFAASENKIADTPNAVDHSPPSADSIPPGTIITTQNWQDYRRFMPDGMAELNVSYLGHRKILALIDFRAPDNPFPDGFFMPIVWPKPSWAKWQLRDVEVIDIRKIPSKAAGYCYGKRIMYVDAYNFSPLWEELFDTQMNLWKFQTTLPQRVNVPGIGPVVTPGVDVELIWDIQRNHASAGGESAGSVYA